MTLTGRSIENDNFVLFGGSSGIGRAAAIELGRRKANVLIVGRGVEDGRAAVAAVKEAGASSAEFLSGDLSTVAGVAKVADGVRNWKPELHGVLHTAMAAFKGKQVTSDGLEFAFALQY
ncbi:SDR family NAD(P)-dependent oxidoreductase, partial [Pseudomonas fluorescens]|nr:SDR family NAD(P)-dependent oxidoreductase [Pseudomonas fluorescens]